ncbi:MAG: MBL fold metallo-hydrolase [Candidatus Omnitrophota bacterium]|jgi:phosphoglycerate dehydrogenase-like enzyme/glyoxylase-like metal-dependent hydrolase (beta-lactamase superfamily II)|nr:MAG: MBL fold metallo-hydrolase [Candidatus Omnitrophota bacterium]
MLKIKSLSLRIIVFVSLLIPCRGFAAPQELAPGVYFRLNESSCNNGWIIFDDYVLVIDANFPDHADQVIADIRKTTDKPIRFVFDTHHHGDHVLGNGVFTRAGATIVAQRHCAEKLLDPLFQQDYGDYVKNKPDYQNLGMTTAGLVFDDKLIFDDGVHRVELLYFGHAHTKGDAVAYLPKEKILFTGDLCVNGVFNYLGESITKNWIEILGEVQELDVETIAPGHGQLAGKDLLETQKQYFILLHEQVQKSVDQGKSLEETIKSIDIPLYKQWTGVEPRPANIEHVYKEITGLITPLELLELDLDVGPSPTKNTPGWTPPNKILVRGIDADKIRALKLVAPNVEFVKADSNREVLEKIADVDGMLGFIDEEQFKAAKKLRWVHSIMAGVNGYLFPEFVNSDVVLTNARGMHGAPIADHVIGMTLMFSKGLAVHYKQQILNPRFRQVPNYKLTELSGKTMLILGLGGIGRQVAQRAAGFDMRILAIDPKKMDKPAYVRHIGAPDELDALLPEADYIVSCVPLTEHTYKYINRQRFAIMKPNVIFINIGRGQTVDQEALIEALQSGQIAGAGLDVADPEPLPSDHPLWKMENVIITPHMSGRTVEKDVRVWYLFRENVRRFVNGEPLLNVVNKSAGY